MNHPTPDRLEALVEGVLDGGESAVLESHLVSCGRCQAEVEEYRTLFEMLASLPRTEPSEGFADRVFARIDIRQPLLARVAAALKRLVPTSIMGLTLATALLSLPVVFTGGATAWLLAQPGISLGAITIFIREKAIEGVGALFSWMAEILMQTPAALWLVSWAEALLPAIGLREVGAAAALFALLTSVSAWVLYRNLTHTSTQDTSYVNYCF